MQRWTAGATLRPTGCRAAALASRALRMLDCGAREALVETWSAATCELHLLEASVDHVVRVGYPVALV